MNPYIVSKSYSPKQKNQGRIIISLLLLAALFFLSFFYLVQTNGLVKQSYQIRQYQERIKQLQSAHQELQIKIALAQSPLNLEEISQRLGMVEKGETVYLQETMVAVRQ